MDVRSRILPIVYVIVAVGSSFVMYKTLDGNLNMFYNLMLKPMQSFTIFVALIIALFTTPTLQHKQQHGHQHVMAGTGSKSLNVFKGPLAYFSGSPVTGFLRNGYCDVPAGDFGNHSVAAEVTEEFLDFTEKQGNELRLGGIKPGCKWCLCASRWREAFDARKNDSDPMVPKVFLSATNEKALNSITIDELKKFAAKEE